MAPTPEPGIQPGGSELTAADAQQQLKALLKQIQKQTEKVADLSLPPSGEYHYYKSFPSFKQPLSETVQKVQRLLSSCQAAAKPPGKSDPGDAAAPDWSDPVEVQEWVSSVIDDALECVDVQLDAHKQKKKEQEQGSGYTLGIGAGPNQASVVPGKKAQKNERGGTINLRVQDAFNPPVDNTPDRPFVHWAPHLAPIAAAQPGSAAAAELAAVAADAAVAGAAGGALPGVCSARHPLAHELNTLEYASWQLEAPEPQAPRPLDDTPLEYVDTVDGLHAMAAELAACSHVAIDLEAHSFRSFQGFTCLMQVSTREKDYIVDALALRPHLGPALARFMADPKIVKVLHGSDHDVTWLQRDFHLYLVNMFDTGQAARVLCYPSHGLAHLLDHFCGVKADKRYQLADWRVRPLAPELLHYARSDTHYLLYIHDRLKQELRAMEQVPAGLCVPLPTSLSAAPPGLATTLERSRQLCMSLHEKEVLDEEAIQTMQARWSLALPGAQRAVFGAVLRWRDGVCRAEDEGTGYVLPKAQVVALAQDMPGTAKDVLRALGRNASEVVKRHAVQLAATIAEAKAAALRPKQQQGATAAAAAAAPAAQGPAPGDAKPAAAAAVPPAAAPAAPAIAPKVIAPIKAKGSSMMAGAMRPAAAAAKPVAAAPPAVAAAPAQVATEPAPQEPAAPAPAPAAEVAAAPAAAAGSDAAAASAAAPAEVAEAVPAATEQQQQAVLPKLPVRRPGGSMAALLGKRPASGTALQPAAAPAPAAVAAAAGGAAADSEEAAIAERVKRLKASFALPFAVPAAAAAPAASEQQLAAGQEKPDEEAAEEEAQADAAPVKTTGAEVRAVMEALRADARSGTTVVMLDESGQQAGGAGSDDDYSAGDDEEQQAAEDAEGAEEEAEDGGARRGKAGHHRVVAGADVGLDSLEFVPLPLSELYPGAGKGKKRKQVGGGEESQRGAPASRGGRGGATLRGPPRQRAQVEQLKRKYIMGLEQEEGAAGSEDEAGGSSSSGGDSSDEDNDGAFGSAAAKRRRAQKQQQQQQGAGRQQQQQQQQQQSGAAGQVVPFDYAAAAAAASGKKRAAAAAAGGDSDEDRGRGRGRGGRGRGRGRQQQGRGGRGGALPSGNAPAFSPFHIPDENLIKGGRRSTVMPRSGNRTFTFK